MFLRTRVLLVLTDQLQHFLAGIWNLEWGLRLHDLQLRVGLCGPLDTHHDLLRSGHPTPANRRTQEEGAAKRKRWQ